MKQAVIATVLFLVLFWFIQPEVKEMKLDGKNYIQVAETFPFPEAESPFVYRILTPGIASFLPFDIKTNFQIVNLLFLLGFCLLLYQYTGTVLSIALFAIPYHTPLRLLFYYPALVDPFFYLAVMACLVMLKKDVKVYWFVLLSFFAVLNREVGIIIPIMVFIKNKSVTPIIGGFLAFALARYLATPLGDYTFLSGMQKGLEMGGGQYLLAVFFAVTPLAVLADFKLERHEWVYLAFVLIMGLLGGGNTVRYLYWVAPVLIPSVVRGLEGRELKYVYIVITVILMNFFYADWENWHYILTEFNPQQFLQIIVITGLFLISRLK